MLSTRASVSILLGPALALPSVWPSAPISGVAPRVDLALSTERKTATMATGDADDARVMHRRHQRWRGGRGGGAGIQAPVVAHERLADLARCDLRVAACEVQTALPGPQRGCDKFPPRAEPPASARRKSCTSAGTAPTTAPLQAGTSRCAGRVPRRAVAAPSPPALALAAPAEEWARRTRASGRLRRGTQGRGCPAETG